MRLLMDDQWPFVESFAQGYEHTLGMDYLLHFSGQPHFSDKEVMRLGFEPICQIQREQPDSGFRNWAGWAGIGQNTIHSLCYTEGSRGPFLLCSFLLRKPPSHWKQKKSTWEEHFGVHVVNRGLKTCAPCREQLFARWLSVGQERCRYLEKGLREEGRSHSSSKGLLPLVPEESLVFLSVEASPKYVSPAPSSKDSQSISCHGADLLDSHLIEPLNFWASRLNIKKIICVLYRGFKNIEKYHRKIK